ncbi:hypothetical protein FB45DRAFT_928002 [Roridomyces roridus]|uniref:Uncharacterized protein n=1 Tax=Roridomyces roridus TaxID=1738132 RepID=A0AAD7BH89_9AGAR|nr:hypothetical protein FB45DRAFT_928002 [Roridomyces roridus]
MPSSDSQSGNLIFVLDTMSAAARLLPSAGLSALAAAPSASRAPKDYKILFRALAHRKFMDGYRPNPRPVVPLPANLQSRGAHRALYTEMLKTCFPNESKRSRAKAAEQQASGAEPESDETLLTTALLSFVRTEDYVAAIIALRVFDSLTVPVSERTRHATLHALAVRLAEAPASPFARCLFPTDVTFHRWTDEAKAAGWGVNQRRLDVQSGKLREGSVEDIELREKATERAMAHLLEANTTKSKKPSRPLENILRNAFRGRGLQQSPNGKPWTPVAVRRAVGKTAIELVPDTARFRSVIGYR